MPWRVIQWTTGNVGVRSLRAILRHPALELVGLFAYGEEKVGRDAGNLVGDPPTRIVATDDIEALLALEADAVSYNPRFPVIDEMERLLRGGVNVISTAGFITGRSLGPEAVARLRAAAEDGGTTLYGTGINPGHINVFALVSAAICDRVDHVSVLESVDASAYASADTQRSVGFAHPANEPGLAHLAREGTAVFGDAVALMGDALGVQLDDIDAEFEFAAATRDQDLGFMTIPAGTVAGVRGCWFGASRGWRVIELRVEWKMGRDMDPDWKPRHGYYVEITGEPCVRSQLQLFPPADWNEPDFNGLGMIMTAMPAVSAIPAVCEAPPGVVTADQLPLVTARGLVSDRGR